MGMLHLVDGLPYGAWADVHMHACIVLPLPTSRYLTEHFPVKMQGLKQ